MSLPDDFFDEVVMDKPNFKVPSNHSLSTIEKIAWYAETLIGGVVLALLAQSQGFGNY